MLSFVWGFASDDKEISKKIWKYVPLQQRSQGKLIYKYNLYVYVYVILLPLRWPEGTKNR